MSSTKKHPGRRARSTGDAAVYANKLKRVFRSRDEEAIEALKLKIDFMLARPRPNTPAPLRGSL
jgi:hypothetical protein